MSYRPPLFPVLILHLYRSGLPFSRSLGRSSTFGGSPLLGLLKANGSDLYALLLLQFRPGVFIFMAGNHKDSSGSINKMLQKLFLQRTNSVNSWVLGTEV